MKSYHLTLSLLLHKNDIFHPTIHFFLPSHSSLAATVCSTSSKHPTSPSSPGNILISPESLSHHSSPARSTGKVKSRPQHVTIVDEKTSTTTASHHQAGITMSASHNQLVATLAAAAAAASSSSPTTPAERDGASTTATPQPTGQLALLYHHTSSQHHHHHLHPILPVARRPSRLPETVYVTRTQEIRA